ncbi:aldehyde dehydrogenase family protein [Pseudonocardia kongjuensis]|uniref:Aldehyde dehydrogenase family protein n=1 Tax=Pseudonocardia kongjuensis TaxID=102227 RepID=A0ABN1XIJ7_9PSEU
MTAVGVRHVRHLVGGAELDGETSFEVRDPGRTADLVATVADGGAELVDRAVRAAEEGFRAWSAVGLDERLAVLGRAADLLDTLVDDLAPVLTRENGGLLVETRTDLVRGIAVLRSTLAVADGHLRPSVTESPTERLLIEKAPIGVAGLVVPWNSPIVLAMSKVAPALAAGNAIVLKPSPEAPVVLTAVLAALAGTLPAGTVNVVNSSGPAGPALTAHPAVRKVSFTGSTAVGREVLRSAADTVKRVSLELGGNDPAIVLDDADFADVVPDLCRGAFTRAGQICFAVKRVYVPRARYAEFLDAVRAELAGYVVGHGLDEGVSFGPLISARQRDAVRGLVERTRAAGAVVEELGSFTHDGLADEGYFLRPALVHGGRPDDEVVTCEQFGPVLPVLPYDTVDEAVALANDSEYGLAGSVWSADPAAATEVARRLEAGCVFVNSHNVWSLSFDMPFGGVKQSGIGRERTALGLQEYVEDRAIRWIARTR